MFYVPNSEQVIPVQGVRTFSGLLTDMQVAEITIGELHE